MEAKQANAHGDILKGRIIDIERTMIASALARTGGNQSQAAKLLGITKRILTYKVRKYSIDIDQFRFKE